MLHGRSERRPAAAPGASCAVQARMQKRPRGLLLAERRTREAPPDMGRPRRRLQLLRAERRGAHEVIARISDAPPSRAARPIDSLTAWSGDTNNLDYRRLWWEHQASILLQARRLRSSRRTRGSQI